MSNRTDTATLIKAMRILARDIESGDGVANAAIAEAADRLEKQAATIAKLPVYANGEAFVPEFDPCWTWSRLDNRPVQTFPLTINGQCLNSAGYAPCYPTAAECEEAEGGR